MRTPVFFDIETYHDHQYSLANMSDVQYALDPRLEVLSVAAEVDGKVYIWRGDDPAWLEAFRKWDREGRRFVAHNSRFDLRVLSLQCDFVPQYLGDTMLVAQYHWFGRGQHSLDKLAKALFEVGKQGEPPIARRLADLSDDDFKRLAKYNAVDVVLTKKLWETLAPGLPEGELDLIAQTLQMQLRPVRIDEDARVELVEDLKKQINGALSANPDLDGIVDAPAKIKALVKQKHGVHLPTIDKRKVTGFQDLPQAVQSLLRDLWGMKRSRKELKDVGSLTSRMGVSKGKILIDLNYCGAHSHRWTSGGGDESSRSFNLQNMRRDGGIRPLIRPEPDHVFIVGDYSQIEARVAAWIANERSQLESFADPSRDIYCEFGEHIFRRPLTKAKNKIERNVAKQAVLGLQYGMGAKRFAETLAGTSSEALQILLKQCRTNDPEEAAKVVVDLYRRTYTRIYNTAKQAYELLKRVAFGSHDAHACLNDLVWFRRHERDLVVDLPTGGFLTYRNIGAAERITPFGEELAPTYLGRTITFSMAIENIVQAIARDILARLLLNLDDEGFHVVFHVHDEVIVQVPESEASARYDRFVQLLHADDPHCPGLPLAGEAHVADRYSKDKCYVQTTA